MTVCVFDRDVTRWL